MYEELMKYPNVVGAGKGIMTKRGKEIGHGIVVMVTKKMPLSALSTQEIIPQAFHDIQTDVLEVGEVRALQSPTDKWRPAPGGVSIGHYLITAGTLGCVVIDNVSGDPVILSNNHVLANSNKASIGDKILQPGPYDGGNINDDVIATLLRYITISFGEEAPTCPISEAIGNVSNWFARLFRSSHRMKSFKISQIPNVVDAAIAKPIDNGMISKHIRKIPVDIAGTRLPQLGLSVVKSGRTTEYTESQIVVMDAELTIGYGGSNYAKFEKQIVAGPMSQGGDSGSLVISKDEYLAVGLLFAGSEQVMIFNPINEVVSALDISF